MYFKPVCIHRQASDVMAVLRPRFVACPPLRVFQVPATLAYEV
jgi:hypothetical protein